MSNNYTVRMPFAGWMDIPVEAGTPGEALDAALDAAPSLTTTDYFDGEWEYEFHRKLVRGNVLSFDTNEASVSDENGNGCAVDLGGW